MDAAHFPQVIRSRSPSPAARRRMLSDVGARLKVDSEEDGKEGRCLSFPNITVNDGNRIRGLSDDADLYPAPRRNFPNIGTSSELESMANVEVLIPPVLSVNDEEHLPSDDDQQQTGNNPGHHGVFTTHHHSTPNLHRTDYGTQNNRAARGTPNPRNQSNGMDIPTSVRSCSGSCTPDQVDKLRRRVKFFFMDPYSKFKARWHLPWKMGLQVLKIIVITYQLVLFGGQRSDVVDFFEQNQRALQHLLLKGWDPGYETLPYPPATGVYAVYDVDDVLDHIQFAWKNYHNITHTSLATIRYLRDNSTGADTVIPIQLCNTFNNYKEFPNGSYVVEAGEIYNCTNLTPLNGSDKYNIREFLRQNNITIPFDKMLELTMAFPLKMFHLNLMETHYGPACYFVDTKIYFTNYERSGQAKVKLLMTNRERMCAGKIMSAEAKDLEHSMKLKSVGLDSIVIFICFFSTVLCIRSIVRALKLKREVEKMFKERFGKTLSFSDRMEFVNLWYILIIINDIFTIIGAVYKIQLETRTATITSFNYDLCSLMLGLGVLLAWTGCLRYLNFFRKYNILILTLKLAFPSLLRFMLCVMAIYFGFVFSGWLILGPYHIKFRYLSTASECLYSLVNGDDMFVTFSATITDNVLVWYFSRIYLYVFISLFIYSVLSLFTSIIIDTYDKLKESYEKGLPKTELQKFVEQCNDPLHSGLYRRQHTENEGTTDFSLIDCLSACCSKKRHKEPNEQTHLLTRTI